MIKIYYELITNDEIIENEKFFHPEKPIFCLVSKKMKKAPDWSCMECPTGESIEDIDKDENGNSIIVEKQCIFYWSFRNE